MKKPTLLDAITTEPSRDRGPVSRGFAKHVPDGTNGDGPVIDGGGSRRAGMIEGASLISLGEAIGHEMWIDSEALDQVVELGNSSDRGLKVRFTHPSMSGDGLGSYLGRAKNLFREGDQVFGDVHFSPTSRETPDGDLGGYVMRLAEDDPESFGLSIVFDHDPEAEAAFVEMNVDEELGVFRSPDEANVSNFPHVRLAVLHGVDFVDSPAANPSGLFHRGSTADILSQAESVLEFVLGLTNDVPADTGGLSAERLRGFLGRFCDGRGIVLEVSKKELETMSEERDEVLEEVEEVAPENDPETKEEEVAEAEAEATAPSEEPVPAESYSRADVEKFSAKFGAEKGLSYLLEGTSFEEALSMEFDDLKAKASIVGDEGRGEEEPVGTFSDGDDSRSGFSGGILPKTVERMSSLIKINGRRS